MTRTHLTLLILSLLLLGARGGPKCPEGMVLVAKSKVCMDRYEWPNKKGTKPSVAMTAIPSPYDEDKTMDAETLCEGVGKRLCEMTEWVTACKGKGGTDYPFGRKLPDKRPTAENAQCNYAQWYKKPDGHKVFKRDKAELARLNQSDKAGERGCVSGSKAEDMMGNVEEWVTCPSWMSYSGNNCRGSGKDKICYCLAGRYWSAPVKCHEMISGHDPAWHDYETGFRCCKDPD